MATTPEIAELAKALVKAQGEFSAVPKGSVNPFFKSKYAALPDVVAHATPILSRNGLAVSQFLTIVDGKDALTTYLLHESGQFIANTMLLHLVKDDPQAQGSATTYARRYSYMSALGLVADDDDDGNSASNRTSAKSEKSYIPENEHQRIAGLLKVLPEDTRKAFVAEAIDKTDFTWKDLTRADLAKVELALASRG